MKVIVAGSRTFNNYDMMKSVLKKFEQEVSPITEIVSGGAKGADGYGKVYALENQIKLTVMKADWDRYGKPAGMIRNAEMADYGDCLLAFWDGESSGTKNMIEQMRKRRKPLQIIDYKKEKYMKVVIVGFEDYDKLTNTMEKLITDSQCYLFSILCGGTTDIAPAPFTNSTKLHPNRPLGETWAHNNGAPVEYIYNSNSERLLDEIAQTADYVVADLSNENQFVKRLVMKMKNLGKHGTVVK